MPDAAEVRLLGLQLLHLGDLGEAVQALDEGILDRPAETLGEGHVLRRRQRLVAEEDDQVVEQRLADRRPLVVAQILRQIDAVDLRPQRARDTPYFHATSSWAEHKLPFRDARHAARPARDRKSA